MMGMPIEKQIAYDMMRNVNRYQPPVDMNYLAKGNNSISYIKESDKDMKPYGLEKGKDNILKMKDLYDTKIASMYRKVA